MSRKFLVVHGIYYFQEAEVRADVAGVYGCEEDRVEVFNWDRLVPTPFLKRFVYVIRLHPMAEIAHAFLAAAHLGFVSERASYSGFSGISLKIHNALSAALLLCTFLRISALPLLAIPLHSPRVFGIFVALRWAIQILVIGLLVLSLLRRAPAALLSTVRRIFLILAWPTFFLVLLAFAYIQIVLVFGTVGYFYLMWNEVEFDLTWIWSICAVIGTVFLASALENLVFPQLNLVPAELLKLIADIIRYIGLAHYRTQLIVQLQEQMRRIVETDPDVELVILSHSLGTVIVADLLLTRPETLQGHPAVTWVTMGSPINRLFARFFPEICPRADQIESKLAVTLSSLRWINIYRRWDYIGSSLGLNVTARGSVDKPSNGWLSNPCLAHSAYWADPVVARKVLDFIAVPRKPADVFPKANDVAPWSRDLIELPSHSIFAGAMCARRRIALFSTACFWIAAAIVLITAGPQSDFSRMCAAGAAIMAALAFFKKTLTCYKLFLGCDSPTDFAPVGSEDAALFAAGAQGRAASRKRMCIIGAIGLVLVSMTYYHVRWPFLSRWTEVASTRFPVSDESGERVAKFTFSRDGRFLLLDSEANGFVVMDAQSSAIVCSGRPDLRANEKSVQGAMGRPAAPHDAVVFSENGHATLLIAGVARLLTSADIPQIQIRRLSSSDHCRSAATAWEKRIDFVPASVSINTAGTQVAIGGNSVVGADVRLFDISRPESESEIGAIRPPNSMFLSYDSFSLLGNSGLVLACSFASEKGPTLIRVADNNPDKLRSACRAGPSRNSISRIAVSEDATHYASPGYYDQPDGFRKFNVTVGSVLDPRIRTTFLFPPVVSVGVSADGSLLAVISKFDISVTDVATQKKRIHQLGLVSRMPRYAAVPDPAFSSENDLLAVQVDGDRVAVLRWRERGAVGWLKKLFKRQP